MSRKLIVEILGDTSGLERSLKRGKREANEFGGAIGRLHVGISTLAKSTVVVEAVDKALEALGATIHAGTEELKERAVIQAQVDAALKSTGDTAHVTAGHIDDLALSLSNLSGIDDELIKSGEATILTFQKVQNFTGRGNAIFDRATKAAVDFAAKTGKSVPQAALAVGRALQAPEKAYGSLRRAQVVLTAAESGAIKAAVRHGDTLKAQKLILDDLQKRYGGQAAALGRTLPGEINVLRARFKDLAGDFGQVFVPALTKAVTALTNFVRKLSEARGTRAKLRIVFEGARDVELALYRTYGRAIEAGIEKLRSIDWKTQLERIAGKIGDALASAMTKATDFLNRVDWEKVGKQIVTGISLALGAAIDFLGHLHWGKLAQAFGKLIVAALKAQTQIYIGIGKALGKLIFQGLELGFQALGSVLVKLGLSLALKIIEPFTHLPKFLGGGAFQDLKAEWQRTLDYMATASGKSGSDAGSAFADGFSEKLPLTQDGKGAKPKVLKQVGNVPPPPDVVPPIDRAARARLIGLRNTWFDNRISRMLDRVQDIPTLQGQIAKLRQIGALIQARINRTKDVTRRLALEDRLLDVTRQIKGDREQIAQNFVDALRFNVDKAGATKTLEDDLRALRRLESYLKERMKIEGRTLDLQQQLADVESQIADVRKQQQENRAAAVQARQFRRLGFGPTGEDLVPGVKALQRNLGAVQKAVEGSFLDTKKTRSVLAHIRQVLSGGLGAVGSEVRSKVAQILADLTNQLKQHSVEQTKWSRHATAGGIIAAAGLNVTPEQRRRLQAQLAAVGIHGLIPTSGGQFAGAGATGIVITGDVHVNGVRDLKTLEQQLQKRAKQRPHVRRGGR